MKPLRHRSLVLSIYLSIHGYAFVLFDGPQSLSDWGVKDIRGAMKSEQALESIRALIDRYHPDYLVIEDHTEWDSRRSVRIRALYRALVRLAGAEHMEVARYGRRAVRATFAPVGARTKYDIAHAIARQMPRLSHRLPKLRKAWLAEDPRQNLFDAAALGVTFYADGRRGVR